MSRPEAPSHEDRVQSLSSKEILRAASAGIDKPENELTKKDLQLIAERLALIVSALSAREPLNDLIQEVVRLTPAQPQKQGRPKKPLTLISDYARGWRPKEKHTRAGRPNNPDLALFADYWQQLLAGKGRYAKEHGTKPLPDHVLTKRLHKAMRLAGFKLPAMPNDAKRSASRILKGQNKFNNPDKNKI